MAEFCSGGTRMIYACSGAADVGEIADGVARKLRDEGFAKMSCLAAIGADLSGYVQTAKAADTVVAIDGCSTGENIARIVDTIRGGKQFTGPGNATDGCGCCG